MKKLEKVTLRSSALSGSEAVETRVCNSGMDIFFSHKDLIWAQKSLGERGRELK